VLGSAEREERKETMAKLAFRPDADGFAFTNSFVMDTTERSQLTAIAAPIAPALGGIIAAIPVVGPFIAPVAASAAAGYLAIGPVPAMGLCGGVCYVSLDYWKARQPIPRGAGVADEPRRGTVGGGAVRPLLWDRLIQSLTVGGVLHRTIEWMIRLNFMTEFTGGSRWLREQTLREFELLKAYIDSGTPWPIALIGNTLAAWDQHQILVYGYEDNSGPVKTLYAYDPNAPSQEGNMSDTTFTLDFTSEQEVVLSGSSLLAAIGKVVGFFCSGYTPGAAPAVAVDYGRFVMRTGTDMMVAGTRLPVASGTELTALGGNAATVRTDPNPTDPPSGTGEPRDGALLRDRLAPEVYVYQGGAPFHIPDPNVLEQFGGWDPVQVVPGGSLMRFTQPPVDGTLLRELSDGRVFRVENGTKRWVTSPNELQKWGGFPSVRLVPDGALAALPDGPNLPTPQPAGPNECANIAKSLSALRAELQRLDELIADASDPDNPSATAAMVRLRVQVSSQITRLNARAREINCP
jgi:hypothetical protein